MSIFVETINLISLLYHSFLNDRMQAFEAIENGNNDFLSIMDESYMFSRDESGNTPLHVAAACSNLPAVEILLQRGSNPNAKNELRWTPLHYAAVNANLAIVKKLLDYNADPQQRSDEGLIPLVVAISDEVRKKLRDGEVSVYDFGQMISLLSTHGENVKDPGYV